MKQFLAFVQKEFYHIFRDKRTLIVLFGMPLAQLLLFGYAITQVQRKYLQTHMQMWKGVFEAIRKFSIPFVALDNDAPLESVCRVFETINSTGTRLTTFDLAVARYYPEPDL